MITPSNEFLSRLKGEIKDHNKVAKLLITPKKGWVFRLISPISNVLEESDMTFISNAFSNNGTIHTVAGIIDSIKNSNCNSIAFEIYGYNGELNEQIVIVAPKMSDISFIETLDCVYIEVKIDDILKPLNPVQESE